MADIMSNLTNTDSCIVCLEDLGQAGVVSEDNPSYRHNPHDVEDATKNVAKIRECGHVLHSICLKEWINQANSCPFCRQNFNLVDVFDKVGGKLLETFPVADKKQVEEFDPSAFLPEEDEDDLFDSQVCPFCNSGEAEESLLLCDCCDAAYHVWCVGLDEVPEGDWYCIECREQGTRHGPRTGRTDQRRTFSQRTQAQVRRGRRSGRASIWNTVNSRIYAGANIDLDDPDDDNSDIAHYNFLERRSEAQRREFQQWQRRLAIASRQGARTAFRHATRPARVNNLTERATVQEKERLQAEKEKTRAEREKTRAEESLWQSFDIASNLDQNSSSTANPRKRKTRSSSNSPTDNGSPRDQPNKDSERKLKRPRTRRMVDKPSSDANPSRPGSTVQASSVSGSARGAAAPSNLSALLDELQPATEDDGAFQTHPSNHTSPSMGYSSPAACSPYTSNHSSPRALSITPPPKRAGSPLPRTSRVEPAYAQSPQQSPPLQYSPDRSPSLNHSQIFWRRSPPEMRHPQPQRRACTSRLDDPSTTAERDKNLRDAKADLSKMVRKALEPYYKRSAITSDQYTDINKTVSRILYELFGTEEMKVKGVENAQGKWEGLAELEVKKAVEDLTA